MSLRSLYDSPITGLPKLGGWARPHRGYLYISQGRLKLFSLRAGALIISLISSIVTEGCTGGSARLIRSQHPAHQSSPTTSPVRAECPPSSPPWIMWTGALLSTVSLTGLLWSDRCSVTSSSGACHFYFQRDPWWGRLIVLGIATTVTGYGDHLNDTQRVCLFEHPTPPQIPSSAPTVDQVERGLAARQELETSFPDNEWTKKLK